VVLQDLAALHLFFFYEYTSHMTKRIPSSVHLSLFEVLFDQLFINKRAFPSEALAEKDKAREKLLGLTSRNQT
jgi:hypothetical protein